MKAKPILFVLITLIIGFVIGMLTSAQIRFNKLKPVRLYSSQERFMDGFFKIIEPDEKQKAVIEEILDRYAKLNSDLQSDFRKELDSNIKEMRKELDSKLTREQLARLKDMDDRRQEMIRQNRRNHSDSTGTRYDRPGSRDGRRFPVDGPMSREGRTGHPGDRQMPPGDRPPFPPPDSTESPDSK